jgi:uroporphyrinogen-III synthase
MGSLAGRRIALLESRSSAELATLVWQHGGVPITAPAIGEVLCHDDFNELFDGLIGRRFSLVIFLSGSGAFAILEEARRRGRLSEALEALRQLTIACRGAKPSAALKRHGLRPRITTAPPHTTHALMNALAVVDVNGRGVALVHSGERNLDVVRDLRARGARLQEVCPYEWTLPDDVTAVADVIRDAIACRLDAVVFTNHVQCRHLFLVAAGMRQAEDLRLSLNGSIVVGAVGPACARALHKAGVAPDVVPASPSMPSLINAMAHYFESLDRQTEMRP